MFVQRKTIGQRLHTPGETNAALDLFIAPSDLCRRSATCVNASTDCERWYVAYRQELAHTRSLQRIAAAKRRAKILAQRKLAGYVSQTHTEARPGKSARMTRKQTLHHFDLACGVLPEDESDGPLIAEETPLPYHSHPLDEGLGLLPTDIRRNDRRERRSAASDLDSAASIRRWPAGL